jgi:hypothetical protein
MTTQRHDGAALDDQLVAAWHRLKAERIANGKLATGLSWLRRYPAAFRRVCAVDLDAAAIAVQHRWDLEPITPPNEAEIAHAEASVERAIAAIHEAKIPIATKIAVKVPWPDA